MKKVLYIFCILLIAACGDKKKSLTTTAEDINFTKTKQEVKTAEFKAYKLNNDYTVVDTGAYDSDGPMGGGSFGIIKKADAILDTIDLYYGMKATNDRSYLYQQLTHELSDYVKESKHYLDLVPESYILVKGGDKTKLNSLTSNFDDYFSSPEIINGKVYFWQLEKADSSGTVRVSAAEFDPLAERTSSLYLLSDMLETDDSNYFTMPYLENGKIVFTIDGKKKWKFSSDFKLTNDVQH